MRSKNKTLLCNTECHWHTLFSYFINFSQKHLETKHQKHIITIFNTSSSLETTSTQHQLLILLQHFLLIQLAQLTPMTTQAC